MKKLLITLGVLLGLQQLQAQQYRNCTVILNAVHRDSSFITAESNKASLQLDLLSNEITLIVKLGTFTSTDSIKNHDFDGPNEKFYFKGRFDGNAYEMLNQMVNDEIQNLSGVIQLNGKEQRIVAKYSIYRGTSGTAANPKILFSLFLPIKLSDYELNTKLSELLNDISINLIRQPVNLVGAQDVMR